MCVCCLSRAVAPASPFARQSTAEDARGEESRERADASVMANATDPLAKSVRGMDPQVRGGSIRTRTRGRRRGTRARAVACARERARERERATVRGRGLTIGACVRARDDAESHGAHHEG